jgi:O-antigen/teichoic acid export membrane protein
MNEVNVAGARAGVFWSVASNILLTLCRLLITAILARFVEPSYFGIYATFLIVSEFTKIATIGFINKNIILEDRNDQFISAAFAVSLLHSVAIAIIIALLAPLIQTFFANIPDLVAYLRWGSLYIIILSINNIYSSVLEKGMSFKWLAIRRVISTLVGTGAISIFLAVSGFNHWALLIGLIAKEIIEAVLQILHTKLKVSKFAWSNLQKVYADFFSISATGLVNKIALNGDYILVSKFLGPVSLGLYSKAYQLMTMPANLVGEAIHKVGLSTLSQASGQKEFLAGVAKKLLFLSAFALIPLSVVLFYSSHKLILIALGPSWLEMVPAFQILALGLFFRFSYKIPAIILQVNRKFKLLLFLQIGYAVIIVGGSYLMIGSGISGVAGGVLIALTIQFVLMLWALGQEVNLSPRGLFDAFISPIIISLPIVLLIESLVLFESVDEIEWLIALLPMAYYLVVLIVLLKRPHTILSAEQTKFIKGLLRPIK